MALVSAKDYLANKGKSKTSNVTTSEPKKAGLISAKEFLASRKAATSVPEPSSPKFTFQENEFGPALQRFDQSPAMQRINNIPTPIPPQDLQSPAHNNLPSSVKNNFAERVQKPNVLDKIFKDNKVMRVINYPFAKAAQMAVPDANYLGTQINARQDFAKRNPIPSTGNATVDKVGDFIGHAGAMFVPIGGASPVINDIARAVNSLAVTKAGQKVLNSVGDSVNPVLNNFGINLPEKLAQAAAQNFTRGAAMGAGYGVTAPFTYGDGRMADVPRSVIENAAMFAAGDAALPFLGAGLRKVGQPLLDKRDFRKAINEFVQKTKEQGSDPFKAAAKENPRNVDAEIKGVRDLIPDADAATKQKLRQEIVMLEHSRKEFKPTDVEIAPVAEAPKKEPQVPRSNEPVTPPGTLSEADKESSSEMIRKLDEMYQIEPNNKLEVTAPTNLVKAADYLKNKAPAAEKPTTKDPISYDEYQSQMDVIEEKLIEKYGWNEYSKTVQNQPYMFGGKLVTPDYVSKIPKEEYAVLEDLNVRRDAVEKADKTAEISRITEDLNFANRHEEWLANKEAVQDALESLYRDNKFRAKDKAIDIEAIKKDLYNTLIQKTKAPSELWGEYALAKRFADNESSSPLGQSTKPLLAQIDDIVDKMLNATEIKAVKPSAIETTVPTKQLSLVEAAPTQPIKESTNLKEPTDLDELVMHKGYDEASPETIAKVYNDKTWYHGTGTDKLKGDMLDPNVGNHESLFGQGIYLTDSPVIAEGYAKTRGRRNGTPTIYETNVNVNKVLDLEKPITPDVTKALEESFGSLDHMAASRGYDEGYFTNIIRTEANKPGATPESLIKKIKEEISDYSHDEGISTNEFVENFQELATNLKLAGFDGITHTGGLRTGKDPHRVLIMLDPQNWYGKTEGEASQITKFEKYNKPEDIINKPAAETIPSAPVEVVQPMRAPSNRQIKGRAPKQPQVIDSAIIKGDTQVRQMRNNPIPSRAANPNAVIKKPITRQQLIKNVRKNFNIVIRTGRIGDKDASVLGIYKTNAQVVRSRNHADIEVISHEIGHHLDSKLTLSDPLYDAELQALGIHTSGQNYTVNQIREEGVAEFTRLYLTDPDVAFQAAPNFAAFFDSLLTKDLRKALTATQKDVATWIDQGPAMQFRGQVNRTGVEANGKTAADRVDDFYTNFVDKFHPLSIVEKAAAQLKGGKAKLADASESLYKKARLFVGTPKKAELVLKDLKAILKPLSKFGYKMKDLGDYAAAKHALELEDAWKLSFKEDLADALLVKQEKTIQRAISIAKSANQSTNFSPQLIQGLRDQTKLTLAEIRVIKEANRIESGFTRAQIKDVLQKYDTPEMKAIQKRLVTYNNNLLDMLVKGKLLTQKAVDAMRIKYPNYVPFFRFFEDDIASGFGGKGFANITSPVKRLKGSTRDIIDPLESIIKNTFAVVNAVEKNKVGLELAKLANVKGMGSYIEKLDGSAQVPKENIVTVFENGEKVQYQLDPELYRSIQQLDEDTVNQVVKFLSYPSSMLRAGATLTPEFILRNPIRDQFQAFVVSNYGYNPLIDLPLGIFHVIGRTNTYKQWITENGSYGGYLSQDRNYLREQLQGLKDERNPWAKATMAIVNPKQWLYLLRVMGEITEEGTKVGEFRNAIKKGATPQEAAYQSRDLMDFGRVGNNIRQVNRIVTFLNANIQGKDRISRAFKNNPIRTTIRAITALTLPTIGIYMWNKHNSSKVQKETLDNAPQWLRDTFFLISVPGTDVVARIPKPFDLAPIFSSIPENILRFVDKNDPQSNGELAKGTALSLLKIPYMITGITPLIENATNYSFFTGAPIVPARDQDLLPEDQYGVSTSLTARAAGKLTGTSPYKVDHLIRGYGAGLGRYATSATDKILEKSGMSPLPPTEEKKISELPVINAFTVDSTGGGQLMDDFYTLLGDMTAKAKSNEKHDIVDGQVIFAQKRLQAASTSIGKLRTTYRDVQGSYKLTPKQKRIQMDKLDVQMNDIAKQTMALLEKVKTIKQKAK